MKASIHTLTRHQRRLLFRVAKAGSFVEARDSDLKPMVDLIDAGLVDGRIGRDSRGFPVVAVGFAVTDKAWDCVNAAKTRLRNVALGALTAALGGLATVVAQKTFDYFASR